MEQSKGYGYLLAAAIIGGIGLLLSALFFLIRIQPGNHYDIVHSGNLYRASLLLAAAMFFAGFSIVALSIMRIKTLEWLRFSTFMLGIASFALMTYLFAWHWKSGWYLIMDPAGQSTLSWSLLPLAIAQIAMLFVASFRIKSIY